MAGLEITHILETSISKLNEHFKDVSPKREYKYVIDKKKQLINDPGLKLEELAKYAVGGELEGKDIPQVLQYLVYFTIVIDEYTNPEDDTKVQRTISYRRVYNVPKHVFNNDSYKLTLVMEFLQEAILVHQVNAYNLAMTELAKAKAEKERQDEAKEKVVVV